MVQGTIWMKTQGTTKEQNVTTTFLEGYTPLSTIFQLYRGVQF
jgi:hypothetical protein